MPRETAGRSETERLHEQVVELENAHRATLNILEDFDGERRKLLQVQKATLNLLEDVQEQRAKSEQTQRALLNILEDSETERANAEREHRISEILQQALLTIPTGIDGVDVEWFYESATERTLVGGDFYDLFTVSPGRVAVSMGDVSGKGIGAASVTAMVKNALRAHFVDGATPAAALTKTNELVHRFTTPETFVTVFAALLDIPTGTLSFAGAGHTLPVVLREGGNVVLGGGGPILGAFPGLVYDDFEVAAGPGEAIVLYTDGLTEARDVEGEFYGMERLSSLLTGLRGATPTEIAQRLHDEVLTFSGGRLRDDVAVLVLATAPLSY
jgi:serine phosphatase RsbU (regulator of sigma subunit)